jgi:hypothetical protein
MPLRIYLISRVLVEESGTVLFDEKPLMGRQGRLAFAYLVAVRDGSAVSGVVGSGLERSASGRGSAPAQAATRSACPEAAARAAWRASEGRALPRLVRPDRGRGSLLRRLRTQRDGHRGGVGGRQPRHLRLRGCPRGKRHTAYQTLREVASRLKGGVLSEVG